MIPTGLKLYFGVAFAALSAAVIGGYTSGGDGVGPLSAGYKGGVGDQVSFTILLAVAFVSVVVGSLLTYFRDADAESVAAALGRTDAPVGQLPVANSIWPLIAGAGFTMMAAGLAVSPLLFGAGLVVVIMVAFEWTMTAWADRATGESDTNETLRDQIMGPFEVPLLGLLLGGIIVLAVSRILLATSEYGAVVVGGVVSVVILAAGILFAQRPNLSKNAMSGIVTVIVVAVLAGGVWGAAAGTREIEHHEEEESHAVDDGEHSETEDAEG